VYRSVVLEANERLRQTYRTTVVTFLHAHTHTHTHTLASRFTVDTAVFIYAPPGNTFANFRPEKQDRRKKKAQRRGKRIKRTTGKNIGVELAGFWGDERADP